MERLQKILSQAGVASRRASEQLMLEGRVTVNGETIRELGSKVDPATDDIRVDARRIKLTARHRYILLNKPKGYVTTRSDPQQRPTVIQLLRGVREYVYPVGRLDFETEGLLLLTNDGDLAARLTHPRHEVPRVYEAQVLGIPDQHDIDRLSRGVTVEGRRTEPAQIELTPCRKAGHATLRITISEGRNRQVRRMFESIGHPVDYLRRIAIGPLSDRRLKIGYWRDLDAEEVAQLQRAAHKGEAGATKMPARRSKAARPKAERPAAARPPRSVGSSEPAGAPGAGRPPKARTPRTPRRPRVQSGAPTGRPPRRPR